MELKKIIAGHLLVLGLIFPHAVSAEDFTFNVEVELANIHPDVDKMRVRCEVEGVTTGSAPINIPTSFSDAGTINTTVQVKFNAESEITPQPFPEQRGYACLLQAAKVGGEFQTFLPSDSTGCSGANEYRCAKPETPSTLELNGVFDLFKE